MKSKNVVKVEVSKSAFTALSIVLILVGILIIGSSDYGSAAGDFITLAGIITGWYVIYLGYKERHFGWYVGLVSLSYLSFVFIYNFSSVIFGY
jgi:nicotinamide riboside transporter PnuC